MATVSPNYVLFLGSSRYLQRGVDDPALSPTAALSVSATLDPEGAGTVTNGTVVAKYNATGNQRGWRMEYLAATQKVKFTVYGAGDGSVYASRETATSITHRRNVTFTYTAGGVLNAYVDGVLDNGTAASAGTVAAIHASTSPLSIMASGGAADIWRGLAFMVAVFDADVSASMAGQAADGLLSSTLAALPSLKAYWKHDAIVSAANNDFISWIDTVASMALNAVGAPKAQQASGTAILTVNQWDVNLSDLALGGQGLSTTYALSSGYRTWGAGLNEPQIASGYRSYRGDFTAVIRCRRVAGRTASKLFRRRGIYLEYILASKELYCIVGDEAGSTNKRISWGFNLFPVEGVDAVFVLRYNAAEKDVDLFINSIKYTQVTNVTTTSNELTTGILVGESTDWQSCAITPKCLSDAQVDTFVNGLAQNTYPVQLVGSRTTYAPFDADVLTPSGPASVGVAVDDVDVPGPPQDAWVESRLDLQYTDAATLPYASSGGVGKYDLTVDDYIYTDPLPSITTAEYVGGAVTVVGEAGPIEGDAVRAWAEIEIAAGEFAGVGDVQFPVPMSTRQTVTFTFQTAPAFNASGFSVRIAVQPRENARRVYYSPPVALAAVLPTDPAPVTLSAVIGSDAVCTATANAGPTNMGNATVWFEEETTVGSDTYQRVSSFDTGQSFAVNRNHSMSFSLGSRTGHTGRKLRFAIQQESNPTTVFRSAGFALTDYTYVAPSPSVQSVAITIARVITATGRAGPTDVGPCATWWEMEVTAGEFAAVLDKRTAVDLSAQTDITDTFTIPPNFPLVGKNLRFAVQPVADPGAVYYSTAYVMSDPLVTEPTVAITAAACSLTKLLSASANLGVSNAGPAVIWWEIEHDPGEWQAILDKTAAPVALTAPQVRNLSYQFPSRLSFTGTNIRLAVQSTLFPETVWRSPSTPISQVEVQAPAVTISSAQQDATGTFTAVGAIGTNNLFTFDVRWEVLVQGDYVAVCEEQTGFNAPGPTTVNANVSVPGALDLVGKQVRLVARSTLFPELSYASALFTVTSSGVVLPSPVVTTASQDAFGNVTLAGSTVASSLSSARVWFEILDIAPTDVDARFGEQTLNLTVPRSITINATLGRLSLAGRAVALKVSPASRPDIVYTSPGVGVTVAAFVNPLPEVLSANVNAVGVFTATGQAGPSDIGAATTWWEAEMSPGEFSAILETESSPALSGGRVAVDASVTLPARFDLTGKNVRLAVRQNSRPDNVYYSSTFPVTVAAIVPPPMNVTAANVSIDSVFTATVVLGENNLGTVKTWWEVEITSGEFTAVLDTTVSYNLPAIGATLNGSAPLPARFDLTSKSARFAVQQTGRPETTYYSASRAIVVENTTDPAPFILSFTVDVWGDCVGVGRAGPTNASFCKVWWEAGIDAGGEFIAILDTVNNVNLFSQQVINAAFLLPRGEFGTDYNYGSRVVRIAVQPNNRPEMLFYSPAVSIALAARVDPAPTITRTYPIPGSMVVLGTAGPTNMGDFIWWIEIEYTDDTIARTEERGPVNLAGTFPVSVAVEIPSGWSYSAKRVRLAFSPVRDRLATYYSPWHTNGSGFESASSIPPLKPMLPGPELLDTLNKPGPGIYRPRVRDFSAR